MVNYQTIPKSDLLQEIQLLHIRLSEAEQTLQAFRSGQVDAVVITGLDGDQIFALQGTDHTYRVLVETMTEGAAVLTTDGLMLYTNQHLATMLQFPPDALIGVSLFQFIPAEYAPILEALLACGQKGSSKGEVIFRGEAGKLIPVQLSLGTLSLPNNPAVCLIATDLTDQKRNEEIIAAERLAHSILDQAVEAIVVCDLTGRVTRANPTARRLCRKNPLFQPFETCFPLDLGSSHSPVKTFSLATVLEGQTFQAVEASLPDPDLGNSGLLRPHSLLVNAAPLRDSQQNIVGGILSLTDITDQTKAHEALQQSQARFRATFEQAAVGIAHINRKGAWLRINQKLQDILGYSVEALMTGPFFDIIDADDRQPVQISLHRLLAGDLKTYAAEIRCLAQTGVAIWVNLTLSLIVDTITNEQYFVAVIEDITSRKQLEAQLLQAQKMEAIGRLAGGIAHDFNNILVVIMGYTDLLGRSLAETDPLRKGLAEIVNASERAAALTRQLLTFSRKETIQPQLLNLNEIVLNMDKMLRRLIHEDIELIVQTDPELGPIRADRSHMEQIILNLVINARDAMPAGGQLTIRTVKSQFDKVNTLQHLDGQPGTYITLIIADTGVGMDQAIQTRIFEPFFTTKAPGQGTGLGLATVYGIVIQSGGHVVVDSLPGKGSTFQIYFPQVGKMVIEPKATPSIANLPSGAETILLVEDEAQIRRLARQILEICGYKVLEAQDGHEAIHVFEGHPAAIHLLVTDVVMPHMDGFKLVEMLTKLYPEIKVLYLSGYTDKALFQPVLSSPASDFLPKPFTPFNLASKVRHLLDQSHPYSE